jgi:hypothetical protein
MAASMTLGEFFDSLALLRKIVLFGSSGFSKFDGCGDFLPSFYKFF